MAHTTTTTATTTAAAVTKTTLLSESPRSTSPAPEEHQQPTLDQLKAAIPKHCFESSLSTSLLYLVRDIIYASILISLALQIDSLPSTSLRVAAWAAYTFAQGCVGTGLWILAHECGHGAFSKHRRINDFIGWAVHSALLVPYFSWKITHARHHRYTGHITKDAVFVPDTEEELEKPENASKFAKLLDLAEETSIVTMLRLLQHQLIGWQLYLLFNFTSGTDSLPAPKADKGRPTGVSHFSTSNRLFLPSQKHLVAYSDLGLLMTLGSLWLAAQYVGYQKVALLYFVPYFWVHHWLVAITYLHHTHPEVPHYTDEAWTYTKGQLGTIDRTIGFIGRHFFHDIIDYHLVHHLFTRIPFYHAEEATHAIMPLIGQGYVQAKDESFLMSLYTTFRSCHYVAERKGGNQGSIAAGKGALFWVLKSDPQRS